MIDEFDEYERRNHIEDEIMQVTDQYPDDIETIEIKWKSKDKTREGKHGN